MRWPAAPFLELGLYLPTGDDNANLLALIEDRIAAGATPAGSAVIFEHPPGRAPSFGGINELDPRVEVSIGSASDIAALAARPDSLILMVDLLFGSSRPLPEVATFVSNYPPKSHPDPHPLVLWRSARGATSSSLRVAREVAERGVVTLKELVRTMAPLYASLSVESSLACPVDLRDERNADALRNCFLSSSLGTRLLHRVEAEATTAGAYFEPLEEGIYISCDQAFNPKRQSIADSVALELTSRIARAIVLATGA